MKKSTTGVLLSLSLASLLLLSSCQREELLAPTPDKNAAGRLGTDFTSVATKHVLLKRGNLTFSYNDAFQLVQMFYNATYYLNYTRHWDEGTAYVTATTQSGNSTLRQDVYTLNQQGRCTTAVTDFYSNGAITSIQVHKYVYNAQGRLEQFYNQYNVKEKSLFFYNANGDLIKVLAYGPQGTLRKTTEWFYNNAALADYYRFNPELDDLDQNLKIFGTFAKRLPTSYRMTHNNPYSPIVYHNFVYELDPQGYPTVRKAYNLAAQLQFTVPYTYQLVPLALN